MLIVNLSDSLKLAKYSICELRREIKNYSKQINALMSLAVFFNYLPQKMQIL